MVLSRKIVLLVIALVAISFAEERRVVGSIVNLKGMPLAGASVSLSGSPAETVITNDIGQFEIVLKDVGVLTSVSSSFIKPALSQGHLFFSLLSTERVDIRVYTLSGRMISQRSEKLKAGNHRLDLFENRHAQGVYVVRALIGEKVHTFKSAYTGAGYRVPAMNRVVSQVSKTRVRGLDTTLVISVTGYSTRTYPVLDERPTHKIVLVSDDITIDSDGDGVTDIDEVYSFGTSPHLIDSDGDGLSDAFETENGNPEIPIYLNPMVADNPIIGIEMVTMPYLSMEYTVKESGELKTAKTQKTDITESNKSTNSSSKTSSCESGWSNTNKTTLKVKKDWKGWSGSAETVNTHNAYEKNFEEQNHSWSSEQFKEQKNSLTKMQEETQGVDTCYKGATVSLLVKFTNSSSLTCHIDSVTLNLCAIDKRGELIGLGVMTSSANTATNIAAKSVSENSYLFECSLSLAEVTTYLNSYSVMAIPSSMKITADTISFGTSSGVPSTVQSARTCFVSIDYGPDDTITYNRHVEVFDHIEKMKKSSSLRTVLERTGLPITINREGRLVSIKGYETDFSNSSKGWVLLREYVEIDEKKYDSYSPLWSETPSFDSVYISAGEKLHFFFTEDYDNDGLYKAVESFIGTSDSLKNSDGDDLTDWEEYKDATRNPSISDSPDELYRVTGFSGLMKGKDSIAVSWTLPELAAGEAQGVILLYQQVADTLALPKTSPLFPNIRRLGMSAVPAVDSVLSDTLGSCTVIQVVTEGATTSGSTVLPAQKGVYNICPYKVKDGVISWGNEALKAIAYDSQGKKVSVDSSGVVQIDKVEGDSFWITAAGTITASKFFNIKTRDLYGQGAVYRFHAPGGWNNIGGIEGDIILGNIKDTTRPVAFTARGYASPTEDISCYYNINQVKWRFHFHGASGWESHRECYSEGFDAWSNNRGTTLDSLFRAPFITRLYKGDTVSYERKLRVWDTWWDGNHNEHLIKTDWMMGDVPAGVKAKLVSAKNEYYDYWINDDTKHGLIPSQRAVNTVSQDVISDTIPYYALIVANASKLGGVAEWSEVYDTVSDYNSGRPLSDDEQFNMGERVGTKGIQTPITNPDSNFYPPNYKNSDLLTKLTIPAGNAETLLFWINRENRPLKSGDFVGVNEVGDVGYDLSVYRIRTY